MDRRASLQKSSYDRALFVKKSFLPSGPSPVGQAVHLKKTEHFAMLQFICPSMQPNYAIYQINSDLSKKYISECFLCKLMTKTAREKIQQNLRPIESPPQKNIEKKSSIIHCSAIEICQVSGWSFRTWRQKRSLDRDRHWETLGNARPPTISTKPHAKTRSWCVRSSPRTVGSFPQGHWKTATYSRWTSTIWYHHITSYNYIHRSGKHQQNDWNGQHPPKIGHCLAWVQWQAFGQSPRQNFKHAC